MEEESKTKPCQKSKTKTKHSSSPLLMPAPSRQHVPAPGFLVYPGAAYYPNPQVKNAAYSPLMAALGQQSKQVSERNISKSMSNCPICMNAMVDLRILPCEHQFHRICLERWLMMKMAYNNSKLPPGETPSVQPPTCPICNAEIKQQQPVAIPVGTTSSSFGGLPQQKVQQEETRSRAELFQSELRRGKWTKEEETYVEALIDEFRIGVLPLKDGTTLRNFLSKLLHCDPMRISKKFVGAQCVGKQVYRNRPDNVAKLTDEDKKRTQKRLADLETKFLEKISSMAKKKRQRKRKSTTSQASKMPKVEQASSSATSSAPVMIQSATASSMEWAAANDTMHRIPSVDNLSFPRIESWDRLFAFPRVASFDNVMAPGNMDSSASNENLSSLLPRVSSLEQLSSLAAAESQLLGVPAQLSIAVKSETKPACKGIPAAGLPRVTSLDKEINQADSSRSTNDRLFRPTSLSNLAGFSENGGISRDSSYQNLAGLGMDYAVGFGLTMSRPISTDKLVSMSDNGNSVAGGSSARNNGVPRVSSIEDILAMVNRSNSEKPKKETSLDDKDEPRKDDKT